MTLAPDVLTFARRMLPHIERGLSFEDAARAVLDDDQRLFAALCDRRHSYSYRSHSSAGELASHDTGARPGDVIAAEMARAVYDRIRRSPNP
jgi:hypothetical protein